MDAANPAGGKSFHALLMECFAEQRSPTEEELDSIASKIWRESHGSMTGQAWQDVARGSDAHMQMIHAAMAALGVDRQAA